MQLVDILTASLPCQPFSIAGRKQRFADERGTLFLHIIRLLDEFRSKRPKILLLENVGNFRSHDDGKTFRRVQHEIQQAGFWFTANNAEILNTAAHTAIPQNRARLFMLAMNCEHFVRNQFKFPVAGNRHKLQDVWAFFDTKQKPDAWYYFTEESQYHQPFQDAIAEFGKKSILLPPLPAIAIKYHFWCVADQFGENFDRASLAPLPVT